MIYMLLNFGKRITSRLLFRPISSCSLVGSCCMGVYIAFCPWVGFHTILVLASALIFPLQGALMLAVSCFINNPWTMFPVYGLDYMVGQWAGRFLWGTGIPLNPLWMDWLNIKLSYYLGMPHVSLWTFLIGGNLLGIAASVMLYPVFKHLCATQTDRVLSWVQRVRMSRGDAQ